MKNKEIEELLNDIKKQLTIDEKLGKEIAQDFHKTTLNYKEIKILLSYIEQLEKENDRLKKDYAIVINNNCDYITLEKKTEQLENNRDKAIEFLKTEHMTYDSAWEWRQALINILKGDSDENIR